jgi:branched-chain amino acid aminotransferase
MKRRVYINGRVLPENKAAVSVFDRGLNYGDGLFETMKAVDGRVEFLRDHLSRLKKGARFLAFPAGSLKALDLDIKDGALEKLLKANGLAAKTASIRITVTRGTERDGGHLPKKTVPTLIIVARPIDTVALERLRTDGVSAAVIRGYGPAIPGVKSLNYLPSVLGKAEAARRGAVEGIFVAKDSSVREGTSSNVFVVSGGVVLTPPVSKDPAEGVLPGVMRQAVIRLLEKKGVTVREATVFLKDLRSCAEAFLTNSVWGAAPLTVIDGKKVGSGSPGDIVRLIQSAL